MSKVWIFDLDDTLHNASAHIFPVMNQIMTEYMMASLDLAESEAHRLRKHYWRIYGATLKGLIRHHSGHPSYFCPYHFLEKTHSFPQLHEMVVQASGLRHMLKNLTGRKVIFTNAPRNYALRILEILGISDCFELVFSVESARFHAKPSVRGFQMLLKAIKTPAQDCILLEDNLPALMTAKRLGMKTIWVSKELKKPNFVDYRLHKVLALTHLKL